MGTIKGLNPLFSEIQQKILTILYLNPDKDFYTNEIIRYVKAGTGATQRELEKFVHAGLITVKKVGNQKRYQANAQLPYYKDLRSIVLKTFGLLDIIVEELRPLLENKIKFAFVYGSFAKQMDSESSDIDLMLIGDDLSYADIFQSIEKMETILERKINPSLYSPSEWQRKYNEGNNFVRKVTEQSKIFLKGSQNELEKLR